MAAGGVLSTTWSLADTVINIRDMAAFTSWIAILANLFTIVATPENGPACSVAWVIYCKWKFAAMNLYSMLAIWHNSFNQDMTLNSFRSLYQVACQTCLNVPTRQGDIRHLDLTFRITEVSANLRTGVITTFLDPLAALQAPNGIMQRFRMAFIDTGMSASKS